jgi:hypothetical protein
MRSGVLTGLAAAAVAMVAVPAQGHALADPAAAKAAAKQAKKAAKAQRKAYYQTGWWAPMGWSGFRRPGFGYGIPVYTSYPAYPRYAFPAYPAQGWGPHGPHGAAQHAREHGRDKDGGLGGGLAGGAVGALAGAAIAGKGDTAAGALIGGGVGALAGAAIDAKDKAGRVGHHPDHNGPAHDGPGAHYPDGGAHDGRWSGKWTGRHNGGPEQVYEGTFEGDYHGEGHHGHHMHHGSGAPHVVYHGPADGMPGNITTLYGPGVTTITVHSAPVTTTTTTTTYKTVYASGARKRVYRKPVGKLVPVKPRCNCR